MNAQSGRPFPRKVPPATDVLVTALGLLMVISFLYAVWANVASNATVKGVAVVQALLFGGAAWIVLTRRVSRSLYSVILVVAVLCRLPLIVTPPRFSSDVYRYIWDGRVQAAGINPYRYVPADPALAHLRDTAIYPKINRRDYARTIYPPAAQAIFLATTRVSESVTWMKTTMVGFEAVTVWIVGLLLSTFGLPRERVMLYAWNPLVIWQFAGDGHIDAASIAFFAVAFLAHARRGQALAGVALGTATLVKLYPAVLFPALYRRWGWKMPVAMAATVAAGYLPYAGVGAGVLGFLPGYMKEEGLLTGEGFFLLSLLRRAGAAVPTLPYLVGALVALLAIGYRASGEVDRTDLADVRRCLVMAGVLLLFFSPHYIWYFSWLMLLVCFAETGPILLYLTSTGAFLLTTLGYASLRGIPDDMLNLNLSLYVPLALLVLFEGWQVMGLRDLVSSSMHPGTGRKTHGTGRQEPVRKGT